MSPVWIASSVLSWIVIALLVVVVLSLLRQLGALRAELGGPVAAGGPRLFDEVPPFRAPDGLVLGGENGGPALLVVREPGCAACEALAPAVAALADDPTLDARVVDVPVDALPAALRPQSVPAVVGLAAGGVVAVVGRPRTPDELREAADAVAGAELSGVRGSQRVTGWGVCAPFWDRHSQSAATAASPPTASSGSSGRA